MMTNTATFKVAHVLVTTLYILCLPFTLVFMIVLWITTTNTELVRNSWRVWEDDWLVLRYYY